MMVNEFERKIGAVFQCEICGFGYKDLDTAERCEEYCGTNGSSSIDIAIKAVYKPSTYLIPART